ncbi:hypothetical protein BH11BAC1_BH11BAC1_25140 [soil metagenome]
MPQLNLTNDWKKINPQAFWGDIAACDHVLQIYENENVFIDLLEGYVAGGFRAGDCVIVIATSVHLNALEDKLISVGFNISALKASDQYIALNAQETLARFMVHGWPDRNRFIKTASELIARARKSKRQVRAFGEMVAILWAQGNHGATIHLEQLWNQFCATESLCLFCAYPQSGFTEDAQESMKHICGHHTKMVTSFGMPKTEIAYSTMTSQKPG